MNSQNMPEMASATPTPGGLLISLADHLLQEEYEKVKFEGIFEVFEFMKDLCLLQAESTHKKQLKAHATGIYDKGKVDGLHAEYLNWLLIDIDEGNCSPEDLHIPYQYILYETSSSTKDMKKWHVLVPLIKPIYAKHLWKINYESNCKMLYPNIKVKTDQQCKDTARRFWIPQRNKVDSFKCNFSDPLYSYDLTAIEKKKPTPSESKTELQDAETSNFINNERWYDVEQVLLKLESKKIDMIPERADWIRVGRALADISDLQPSRGVDAFTRLSRLHREINPSGSDRNSMTEEEWGDKFIDDILNTASGEVHLGTFFNYAKKVDCYIEKPKPQKDNGILYLIRSQSSQTTFTLSYKNTKEQDLVKLYDQEESMACIIKRLKKDVGTNEFELKYEDITFSKTDPDTQLTVLKEKAGATIEVDFRETPKETGYLLGAAEIATYVDKSKYPLVLLHAKHSVLKGKPIFNKNIDEWLRQFVLDYDWLCRYLYWFRDCSVALPALLIYGESDTGKSLFGILLASLFSGIEPMDKFFINEDFCNAGGMSPVITMEEEWQCGIEPIKTIITSRVNEINQKNKGLIRIYGYHRLIVSHNEGTPNIPKEHNADSAATDRRFQLAKHTPENNIFMKKFDRLETNSWHEENKFLNHVEWIKKELGTVKKDIGAFAVATYRSAEQLNGMSITSDEEVVVSDFVLKKYGDLIKHDKTEQKEFIVYIKDVREEFKFSHKKITGKGDDDLAEFIKNIFGGKKVGIRCDRVVTGKRVRIPVEIIKREFEHSNREH